MRVYGVYDVLRAEQCVTTGTADQIIRFLRLNARSFDRALRQRKLINKRYEVIYLYTE